MADHVHLLVSLAKTVALSDLMLNIKRDSSRWLHRRPECAGFAWQSGYFAFSIGESGVEALKAYIAGQRAHHAGVDFKDEVRAFLRKYGVQWDDRLAWE
ncbi:MAG: transposase [Phycisphaeraceae bacterium]|nr:transposase [Phycisphaeraceae bacterium]